MLLTAAREPVPVANLDFLGVEMKAIVCGAQLRVDLNSFPSFVL